jgi:hypothetical protein
MLNGNKKNCLKGFEIEENTKTSKSNILKTKPRKLIRSKESLSIPESLDSTETTERNDDYNEVVLNQSDEESKRKYSSRIDFADEKSKQSLFDDDLSIIVKESYTNFPTEKQTENKNDDSKSFLKTNNDNSNIIDIKSIFPAECLQSTSGANLLANGLTFF